jgi:heparinase II/III-like protein
MSTFEIANRRWLRFCRMGWDEMQTRAQQEISKRWDYLSYAVRQNQAWPPTSANAQDGKARFFFTPEEISQIVSALKSKFPEQATAIVAQAGQICRHQFDLLGYESLGYGAEIDWHLDIVHGKRSGRQPWYRIRYLDFEEVGDSKVIWELNRHQHLVILAKAYCLTGQKQFANEIVYQWYHWRRENPYPIGINWASSLEVAVRSLSWFWVRGILAECPLIPEAFWRDLDDLLSISGNHIERYLSTYFSPNTHLLGEGVALFFLGTLRPNLSRAERFRTLGWEIILREAQRQVLPDGMHFESSTYYHVYAVDFFLHAYVLALINEVPVDEEFVRVIVKMLGWLAAIGQAGVLPRLGDDDGGRVFDPRRNRAEHLFDPLALGAVLFRRADFKALAGAFREEALWLSGVKGLADFESLPILSTRGESRLLESSGICVMTDFSSVRQQLSISAGAKLESDAGHAHADALSISLGIDGAEWLADPGTCCYVSNDDLRNHFRSTAAHNTLCVDGRSQATPAGPFSWKALANVQRTLWVAEQSFDLFEGIQSGYCRIPQPVTHRRLVFCRKSQFWLVYDVVEGRGTHELEVFWHFAPDVIVEANWPGGLALRNSKGQRLALLYEKGAGINFQTGTGWYSGAYGRNERSLFFRESCSTMLPAEFLTVLFPLHSVRDEFGETAMSFKATESNPVSGHTIHKGADRHVFFFGRGGQTWRAMGWESDARLLYCQFGKDGGIDHLILCEVSRATRYECTVFSSEKPVKVYEWATGLDQGLSNHNERPAWAGAWNGLLGGMEPPVFKSNRFGVKKD